MNSKFIIRYKEKPWYKDKEYLPVLFVFIYIFGTLGYTLYVDYNSIDLHKTNFNGKIDNIFNQKSTYYLKISNKKKWIRLKNFRNEEYENLDIYFMDIVKKGDSIYKTINSDTIHLIKSKNKYSFCINHH